MYSVWFYESGKSYEWTLEQCHEYFGKNEFAEYLGGYFTNVVVVEL